ncbi:hypothetical protein Goshw_008938 [Gossypium schwendimanii]|uniref:Uncharacterized protein n=1 Tax=Gossypium schwendimanii TaxID=34291 RepID=A0A7J9L8T1_GOSSC|nr:hypothetical protein [Gossypium schwendimanii]
MWIFYGWNWDLACFIPSVASGALEVFSDDEANRILSIPVSHFARDDMVSWLGFLCNAFSGGGAEFVLITIWALWLERNCEYHESLSYIPLELLSFICSYLGGLSALGMPVVGSLGSCTIRWLPLAAPLVKANFDVAYKGY